MKKIFFGLILVFATQACSEKLAYNSVAGTKWVLSEWPEKTMPSTTKKALLNFGGDNKISGKSFCNGFGGSATISGNTIKFSELIGTMMFCEDVGEAEKNYLDDLKSVTSFKVENGKLHLYKDGAPAMVFIKTE